MDWTPLSNLRHAYAQLVAGVVRDQRAFADGLIAPVIRALEGQQQDEYVLPLSMSMFASKEDLERAKAVQAAPERIFLQADGATWCSERINDDDVEYVRADRAAPGREPAIAEEVDRVWHALKRRGWHPGRTDDTLSACVQAVIDAAPIGPYPRGRADELLDPAAPAEEAQPAEPVAEAALRRVLDVVNRYLPPDGISHDEAITEIIGIVDPWPIAAPSVAREDAQVRAQALEEARDMLDDARLELKMIREALGVPYEPHQSLQERTLEAASRLLPQPNTKEYDALVDAVEKAISVGPMDTIHAGDRHHWDGAWHYEPPPEPRSDHHFLQGRTACAIRAVDAVLRALKEQP